ncbi:MAG: hypothetical protein ACREOI_29115, partial [bacterium]
MKPIVIPSTFKVKSVRQKQKNLPPMNAEYAETHRNQFYSAKLGGFGEVRRLIFSLWLRLVRVAVNLLLILILQLLVVDQPSQAQPATNLAEPMKKQKIVSARIQSPTRVEIKLAQSLKKIIANDFSIEPAAAVKNVQALDSAHLILTTEPLVLQKNYQLNIKDDGSKALLH